ncbi:MAG: HEAT repeat domain-containing protein [bacterium]
MTIAEEKPKGIPRVIFFLFLSTLLGIFAGQLLGTFLVATSNHQLWFEQEAIARLGFLAVPGHFLTSEMKAFSTYLAGGIFFALSIGLGYGFFWGLILWIFSLYRRKWYPYVRLLPIIILSAILIWQGRGTDRSVLLFLLSFPLLIYAVSFPVLSKARVPLADVGTYGFIFVCFSVLLVITFRQLDFIEIRDRVLLPTEAGRQIDEFYYRYTLYPARLVQPLCYRLQNVVVIDAHSFPQQRLTAIQDSLRRNDWFAVSADPGGHFQAALGCNGASDEILFYWRNGQQPGKDGWMREAAPVYRVLCQEFMNDPAKHLEEYSLAADPYTLLRTGCGICLFFILPLAVAFFLFTLCVWLIRKGLSLDRSNLGRLKETVITLGIILILFLALITRPLWMKTRLPESRFGLWQIAKTEEPGDRIGALKRLDETLDPQTCMAHQGDIILLARDPNPVVRRFAARLIGKMAASDEAMAFPLLLSLLEDSNINVVYTAAESLCELPGQRARAKLDEILRTNQPWYLKMKVYHALKEAGWHQ